MEENKLLAKLSLFDATLLVIGAVIGSGIFLTTGIIAESLPSPGWILLVWFLGGALTLFGGLTLAELGAMMPEAGGQYIYLRETYGPAAGFMYGWTTFLVTQTGGIAALGVGFAEYLSYFFPFLGLDRVVVGGGWLSISSGQLVAVASIALLSLVNYYGVKQGSLLQNIFTILKVGAIAILVVAGFFMIFTESPGVSKQVAEIPQGFGLLASIGVALIAVLWTFDGWYAVNVVASEIKNAKKNLPLSLIIGISFLAIIYLIVNLFYLNALPMEQLAGEIRVGETATTAVFGSGAGSVMSALILVSIFGCLGATILFGPRIYYAMSRDGLFFKSLAYVHPNYRTPSKAITWQGVWAASLCLTGTYEQLFTYVVVALLAFYVATAAAVFILRSRMPEMERPYRVWGYPVIPALFGFSMIWIMINSFIEKPVESLVGFALILAGVPVYLYWKKKSNRN